MKESKARKIKSWALNGNHDMYAGGHGYFKMLKREQAAGEFEAFLKSPREWILRVTAEEEWAFRVKMLDNSATLNLYSP